MLEFLDIFSETLIRFLGLVICVGSAMAFMHTSETCYMIGIVAGSYLVA